MLPLLPLPHISLLLRRFFRYECYPSCPSRVSIHKRVFLAVADTPLVFIDYISPIGADSNRLRLVRTDLKLFGEIKDTGESGVFVRYKKTAPTLLSFCFHFAFTLLSTVQIAREIVRHEETLLRLNNTKGRRDRNLETR